MLKLDSGLHRGESPVDGCVGLVALGLQGTNLSFEGFFIGNAASQTLFAEDAELNLRHVEPAAVLGSKMKLQVFAYSPGLLGLEGFVERSGFMGVQVVQDHPNLFCFWVSFIDQPPHLVGKVNHGAPFSHFQVPPAGQGLTAHKQVAGPITLILIVKSFTSAALGRDGSLLLCHQLLGSLVETDDWTFGVVGFRVEVQHIFHTRHKVGAYLR